MYVSSFGKTCAYISGDWQTVHITDHCRWWPNLSILIVLRQQLEILRQANQIKKTAPHHSKDGDSSTVKPRAILLE